jgi:hypothetical protein
VPHRSCLYQEKISPRGIFDRKAHSPRRNGHNPPMVRWNWKLTSASALIDTLAFNLIFFIQELFLVLPKAFTPGLRPTLFHNNHSWDGDSPLVRLFQGTGALATFITASVCAILLRRGWGRTSTRRLFLIWLAYNGFFQSLPQVIIGAFIPANDVGMAMDYFGLSSAAKMTAAMVAVIAMPVIAVGLTRPLLSLAEDPVEIGSGGARTGFIFGIATLPAVAAVALIIPFRVPRNWIEVAMVPVVVTCIGIIWMQAAAWLVRNASANGDSRNMSVASLAGAVVVLLLVFQLVLRPGIHFY